MKCFLGEDFLLESDAAVRLFQEYAKDQPIFDYHCHLPVEQIESDHRFSNLTEIWLDGDHYKWRAMRANGVDERLITGDADPYEKFSAWVATVPYTLRNPLYHWNHLELRRYFGIDLTIEPQNAKEIWDAANAKLKDLAVSQIFEQFKVAVVCTTDDPADAIDHHKAIAARQNVTRVYPAFRPDRAFAVDRPDVFCPWLSRLGGQVGSQINSFEDLVDNLRIRHADFHAAGSRLSDHGIQALATEPLSATEAGRVFRNAVEGVAATPAEKAGFTLRVLVEFGRWDAERGWTKQLHLGALRDANSAGRARLGPDTGFDSIGDYGQAQGLQAFMDRLESESSLPQMVLYNVNPTDNYLLASMAGNFQSGGKIGKIQFGSGWWYLDQKEGIQWQLNALSNVGLLRRFVGMLTDSRSFLSYPRHEYFRRVLCNLLGEDMERGELPPDFDLVGATVKEICFSNAKRFFGLELDPVWDSYGAK